MIREVSAQPILKVDTRQNPRLYMSVGLLLVFIMAARTPLDSDMWWHLRAGEWMVQNGRVLMEDLFSFTRAGMPWINHSWLSEIILYLFFKAGGVFGLSLLTAFLATLSMGIVLVTMQGSALFRSFILVLMTPVAAVVWSPRPQMFSLVMLAATNLLLHRYREGRTSKIWLLVPLFVIWSNLHGGYALGLILIGAVIAGILMDKVFGFTENTLAKKQIITLIGWTAAAWAAVAINPNGISAWFIPFKTVGVSSLQNLISEWASPDFHQIIQWPFLIILILLFMAVGNSSTRLSGGDFAITATFTALALIARRNFGPFAIAVAPILSVSLVSALSTWGRQIRTTPIGKRLSGVILPQANSPDKLIKVRTWINALLIILLTLAGLTKLFMVTNDELMEKAESRIFPVHAVEWVNQYKPNGRMVSSYGWGGYLQWHLRDYPVFIDGRTDLYDDEIIQEWLAIVHAESGWEAAIKRWGINLALLEPEQAIVRELKSEGWQTLYEDSTSVLL